MLISFVVRMLVSAFVILLASWPFWIYYAARQMFSPEGFWQEFFLFGIGVWMLGAAQLVSALAGLFGLFLVWTFDR